MLAKRMRNIRINEQEKRSYTYTYTHTNTYRDTFTSG